MTKMLNPVPVLDAANDADDGRVSREVVRAQGAKREVTVSFEALEDAFENNAPEIHSYLHLDTGEVIRIVDGIADPDFHQRVMSDDNYLRVDPVSSREQYRWMEKFIEMVTEPELKLKLNQSIDGKGAFRRFKDVLTVFPEDREKWFTFRSERLRENMETWLSGHRIQAIAKPKYVAPEPDLTADAERPRARRAGVFDVYRQKLRELVEIVPGRELEHAVAFMEFLRERRRFAGLDSSEQELEPVSGETELEVSAPPTEAVQRANQELEARLRGKKID